MLSDVVGRSSSQEDQQMSIGAPENLQYMGSMHSIWISQGSGRDSFLSFSLAGKNPVTLWCGGRLF